MNEAPPAVLTGRVVRPGDAAYAAARAGWNLRFEHRPQAIVFVSTTDDVVNALTWARRNAIEIRVRSGRHNLEGWSSVDDGIVIDVSDLKRVSIDPAAGTATVGAGLTQLEAVTALGAAGFAAPTGTEGSVGLAGATLGGGFGLLTRAFGMACDNLLGAEIVVMGVDGVARDLPAVVSADAHSHPDLLWALRGAGNGTYGVVTSLTYAVHPLARAVYVTARWADVADLREVFTVWQRSAPVADTRLTSQLEIHRDEILLFAVLAGGTEAQALDALRSILSVGRPHVDSIEAPWAELYAGFQIPIADEPANWMFASQFITDPLPAAAVEIIASFMSSAPTPECNYFTNAFGGAVTTSEPAGGAAFAHRGALFYAEPGAGWGVRGGDGSAEDVADDVDAAAAAARHDDSLSALCCAWVTDFGRALEPYVGGAYVNVPNAGMPEWATAYWGDGVERLGAIKSRYDPDNVFRYEQSVPLAEHTS
ncbi:MAG: FAD/FMN-dependent dehydrogenase [Subtercola sp.]|nr:FAD/FMN-dependent dehydrogenase [Subtercola sp.]